MSVNGVTNSNAASYYTQNSSSNKNSKTDTTTTTKEDTAAVYEASAESKTAGKTYADLSKVNQLKTELSSKSQQMQSLVNALFKNQSGQVNSVIDLIKGIQNGTVSVDPATSAAAQAEIGEDGYWGIEKTSDRLVEMAKALSGGDASKADELIAAMKKGFDEAAKACGGKLPDICSKTIDAATKKMTDWRDSVS